MKTISIKIFVFEAEGGEKLEGRGEKNRREERMDNGMTLLQVAKESY